MKIFLAALLFFAAVPSVGADTFPELTDDELPEDVRDIAPPPPPLTRSGALADLNDTGAVTASRFFDGFVWSADARVRFEAFYDDTRVGGASDRNRARYSFRGGFTKRINPRATVGFRLATGVAANPASTFQSVGDAAVGKSIDIDRLYLDLTPLGGWENLSPILREGRVVLGKHAPPFAASSPLVWDRDVNLEGVSESIRWSGWPWTLSASAGQYFLDENQAPDDPYLLAHQLGLGYGRSGELGPQFGLSVGHSHFIRPYGNDATSQSGTNFAGPQHLAPAGFSVLDVTGTFSTPIPRWEIPLGLTASWAGNLEAERNTVTRSKEDDAWLAELSIGRAQGVGTWELGGGYRRVEADAVLGQFAESEFATRYGNTDAEGWFWRGAYVLWPNTTVGVSGYHTEAESTRRGRPIPDRNRVEANIGVRF